MALVIQGGSIAGLSGSLAGNTFTKNGTVRRRAIPTDPQTQLQVIARTALGYLATAWQAVLTDAQRAGWETYAQNTPMTDRIGRSIRISGLAHFCRSNQPRYVWASLDETPPSTLLVKNAPTVYNLAPPPQGIDTSTANTGSPGELQIQWDESTGANTWRSAAGGFLFLQASRPVDPTTVFFKGPWMFQGAVPGASTAPSVPFDLEYGQFAHKAKNAGQALAVGQLIYIRARASLPDGRLSTPVIARVTVS
jgi:hypothetical protein